MSKFTIIMKSTAAIAVAVTIGGIVAVGIEIFLEMHPVFNDVDRSYKSGLWLSDFSIIFGALAGIGGGLWGWKDADTFRDLILIDFFGWIRGLFKSR